jgi:hypothetical protein
MDQPVGTLRLVVGSDDKLRVTEQPPGMRVADQTLRLDEHGELHRATIEQLVEMARLNRFESTEEYRILGWNLYDALFGNAIGEALHRMLQDRTVTHLRVVLEFEKGQHQLASWPWEYLYCPEDLATRGAGYFLSQRTKLVLIRNLPSVTDVRVTVEEPPVRMLFVASRPAGTTLSYESVLETLRDLEEGSDRVSLEVIEPMMTDPDDGTEVPAATYDAFIVAAERFKPHVIHIVAHGQRVDGMSRIAFMRPDRGAHWVSEGDMANDLGDLPDLRFVVLEACESAQAGFATLRQHHVAISGVAMTLAHIGVPAVVGMQYEINQGAANVFARELYKELSRSEPVDVAVMKARRRLDRAERNGESSAGGEGRMRPGFGLPVLYLSDTAALFPPVEPEEPPQAPAVPAGPPGPSLPFGGRTPTQVKGQQVPPPITECARCSTPCNQFDSFCAECENYLKCPRCGWPVLQPRAKCGHCRESLQVEDVPLDPPRARRGQLPAVGRAGEFG